MARGRVITPDFWSDGNMVGVSSFARLFYIGTWNFAYCDKGHLDDDAMGLKLKILPADDVDPLTLLEELMACGRIVRIRASNGKTFLFIPTFARWQKADPRWKTRCPACALINSGELTETQESLVEHSETLPNSALREEESTREYKREEDKTSVQGKPARDYSEEFETWWDSYPRKQAKPDAFKAFKAARKTTELVTLLNGVNAYKLLTIGSEKGHLKMPAGWLRDRRWEDEPVTTPERRGTDTWEPPRSPRRIISGRIPDCGLHPGYPLPCEKCARDGVSF